MKDKIKSISIAIIIIIALLAFTIYTMYEILTSPKILTLVFIFIIAVMLFFVKHKRKITFGVFELLLGIICAINPYISKHFDINLLVDTDNLLLTIAGIFMMIQAFENIIKGMNAKKIMLSKYLRKWGFDKW
ncbi:hypothetical protein D0T53_10205 [Dysgonomonas sp. 216]|uniref:hypothetical protein n=1 Tax=Dysgonomonas sp. 216 TaxID=2302934 RepID=UPI0013D29F14|nr:hypothetical protein [Dysgonomonas sp. 216]NDW19284.1 hypothetical protein [Dysgonomonas sp. 216]